jgi:hypothetical protein
VAHASGGIRSKPSTGATRAFLIRSGSATRFRHVAELSRGAIVWSTMEAIQAVLDLSFRRPLTPRPKPQEVNRSELVRRALREHLRVLRVADLQECDRRGYQAQSAAENRGVQRVGEGGRLAGRLNRLDVHLCRLHSLTSNACSHIHSRQHSPRQSVMCRRRSSWMARTE